jgi:hypothetical protein
MMERGLCLFPRTVYFFLAVVRPAKNERKNFSLNLFEFKTESFRFFSYEKTPKIL